MEISREERKEGRKRRKKFTRAIVVAILPGQHHELLEGVLQEQLRAGISVGGQAEVLGSVKMLHHVAAAFLGGSFVPAVDVGLGVAHGACERHVGWGAAVYPLRSRTRE